MAFVNILPFIVLALIWISLILLVIILMIFFHRDIQNWEKVYSNCDPKSAKYEYIVRLTYTVAKKNFEISNTNISIEFLNTKSSSLMKLSITPKQMLSSQVLDESNMKVVKLLVYRKDSLSDIGFAVLNHDGVGTINVPNVELQDTKSNYANVAFFGQPIAKLESSRARKIQIQPMATQEYKQIESGIRPSRTVSSKEFICFIFLSVNVIVMTCAVLIPCTQGNKLCDDYRDGIVSSLLSAISSSSIAALIFSFTIIIYRFFVKSFYSANSGHGCWSCIRIVYLLLILITGTAIGVVGAMMASNKFPEDHSKQTFAHQIYWMFGVGIAIVLLIMFWISGLSIIAYLIGFFKNTESRSYGSGIERNMKSLEKMTNKTEEQEDEGEDFYKTLTKGGNKVKSISQYAGIQATRQPQEDKSRSNLTKSPPVSSSVGKSQVIKDKAKKTKSTESVDSGYYKTLMTSGKGKVKSVSQYKGIGG